ncbi:MAG: HEAT repeat domain-containing protein [Bacteroidota bacterium]
MKNLFCKTFYLFIFIIICDLSALAQINPQSELAGGGLQSKYPVLRATTAHKIAETGNYRKNEIDLLIKCLNDYTRLHLVESLTDSSVTYGNVETTPYDEARNALVRIGKPAVDKLISAVKSDSLPFGIGYKSAECLGLIGDKKALPTLIQLLIQGKIGHPNTIGDEDEIPLAVARIGRKEVYDELLAAYNNAKANNRLNDGLIWALGYSQDERFFPILKNFISGEDRSFKLDAIHALGYSKNKKALPILVDRLKEEDLHARWYSCEALEEIGNREAIPYLKKFIESEKDEVVLRAANKAIKKLEK